MSAKGLSLTTRIFLGTGAVVAAVLGAMLLVINLQANSTAKAAVARSLSATQTLVKTKLEERQKNGP